MLPSWITTGVRCVSCWLRPKISVVLLAELTGRGLVHRNRACFAALLWERANCRAVGMALMGCGNVIKSQTLQGPKAVVRPMTMASIIIAVAKKSC